MTAPGPTPTNTHRASKPTLAELRARYPRSEEPAITSRRKPSLDELRRTIALRKASPASAQADPDTAEPLCEPTQSPQTTQRPDINALRAMMETRCGDGESATRNESEPDYKRSPLQAATAEWLGEVEWNLMITLTFDSEKGVSLPLASKLFGQFIPRLQAVIARRGSRRRIRLAAIVEDSREQLREAGIHMDGREGTHIHVLLHVRGDDPYVYKQDIIKAWKATNRRCGDPRIHCPNSDEWFLPLTCAEERDRLTGYVLKHHGEDTLGLLIQYLHLD